MPEFDYVIAGAGPGGCVLAHRLSADPTKRVLLLEAGPPDRHPLIHVPKGIGKMLEDPNHVWPFEVQGGGVSPWVRGRTLGGSSSINGMMYVRGQPADFEALAALAGNDWNWSHIGAAYKAIERHQLGEAATRGANGPLKISLPEREEVIDRLVASAVQAGMAEQADINAPDDAQKVGYSPRNIWGGRRQSAAVAFLDPVRARPNLHIRTGVLVDHVVFVGRRATGLTVWAGGKRETIEGGRIILCGGTLSSPLMLQRSGIGPAALLRSHGIEVVVDSPEVGQNLREHSALLMQWRLNRDLSKNREFRGARIWQNFARYYLTRGGPLAGAVFEMGGWFKSRPELTRPDIQFLGASISVDQSAVPVALHREPGIQIAVTPLRPRSLGSIDIGGRDVNAAPRCRIDYFQDPEDCREMVAGVKGVRRVLAQGPIAEVIDRELRPGPDIRTDDEILQAYRTMGGTAWHASGTCRMGLDAASVVDPLTRVRGVDGLHVVDLSIAPVMLAGNTNAPTHALAWRAADLILNLQGARTARQPERQTATGVER